MRFAPRSIRRNRPTGVEVARTGPVLRTLVAAVGLGLLALPLLGAYRWTGRTRELRARLESGRRPAYPPTVDFNELGGLPSPVRRYFHTALTDGQQLVSAANVEHVGRFNVRESGARWAPFTSTQRVVTRRPGFVWDGRIRMLPGIVVRVHDAYVEGEGILRPALLGLFPLADMHDRGGAVAQGELMRFFAESAWYPTALLPSQGVEWTPVDDRSASATLTVEGVSLTLVFRFGEDDLIQSVYAAARGRTVGRAVIPTPWEARFAEYEERSGMHVPLSGEVAWLLPEGRRPYWRGRITRLMYEFTGDPNATAPR